MVSYAPLMKVMFLIPHVSSGGAEKILSDLSFNLQLGEPLLVVFERREGYPFHGRLISMDLPIERHSIFARVRGFFRRVRRFTRILRQERPDCVVSFMGEANFINALVSRRPILTVHNHLSSSSHLRSRFESRVFDFLLKLLYRRAMVVAVSHAIKDDLIEHYGIPENRVTVIVTAVDTEEIQRRALEDAICPWDKNAPVVITAGRLRPEKGQWHLLRAFAEVRKKTVCRLAILGTGELEDYLRGLARDLGVENDVFFLGWQDNPFKFLARADVFVLPSVTEGFPLVMMEAMACKLPVVATDCAGSTEILAPGGGEEFGLLVPRVDKNMYGWADPLTKDELAMADAIFRMLKNADLRQRFVSAGLIRLKTFGREAFLEKYRRVVQSA